jgi:diguanylate cyclase (GGDEF)-like protein/PAS domain S-box-containing protein
MGHHESRNKRYYDFTGAAPVSIDHDGWNTVAQPEDRERVWIQWCHSIQTGEPYETQYRLRHHSGEYRWILARAIPDFGMQGRIVRWLGTSTDIHEQRHATEALRINEERLRLAIETTRLGIWDADLITGKREWTREARDVLRISPETPATRDTFLDRIHPEDRTRIGDRFFAAVPENELVYGDECRVFRADNGEERWVAVSGRTFLDEDGRAIRKLGTIQDITERKRAEEALRDSETRLQLALQAARMVAWERDTRTDRVTRSENSLALLGLGSGPDEAFLERIRPEDRARREEFLASLGDTGTNTMEFRYFLPDGRSLWLGTRAQKAGPHRVVGVTFDITDRKAAEEEIWPAANHDPLTGLPNRALLQHRLDHALKDALEKGTSVSLLLIDLNNFKDVNDSLGHAAGDALLKETAARLSDMMRECDTVVRLGGDEFAVIVVEPLKLGNAISLADNILQRIRQPFAHKGRMIVTRASIGVAAFPEHDSAPAELLKDADIALYQAKADGRSRVVTYSASMRMAAEHRLALLKEIREALRREEIIPFYQPKVCLSTRRMIGLEALARWQHPVKGLLTPATFGLAFDDPELAIVLSKRLIGKIVSDIRKWLIAGIDPGRVAINFSSSEFSHPDLADNVLHVLDLAKVPAKHLEIEVTEKVLLEGRSGMVSETLEKFRKQGVQIALDDFGTGYASLTHLKQFPVSHIKIDQSFVRDLECDPEDRAIVEAVIGLAKSLNLQVTAEGVETEGQLRQLREMGCHNAQGYLFARPMAAARVVEFLASQNGPTAVP